MSGCAGGGNTELEIYEKGIVIESLVLFAFKVCVGIWAGKAIYLFLLPPLSTSQITLFLLLSSA